MPDTSCVFKSLRNRSFFEFSFQTFTTIGYSYRGADKSCCAKGGLSFVLITPRERRKTAADCFLLIFALLQIAVFVPFHIYYKRNVLVLWLRTSSVFMDQLRENCSLMDNKGSRKRRRPVGEKKQKRRTHKQKKKSSKIEVLPTFVDVNARISSISGDANKAQRKRYFSERDLPRKGSEPLVKRETPLPNPTNNDFANNNVPAHFTGSEDRSNAPAEEPLANDGLIERSNTPTEEGPAVEDHVFKMDLLQELLKPMLP
ncbi:unnamed protein product [Caenorhabditis auriculariae]|uniref:Uncharacterized protein n=1 Tax=Caenorhabditis auriculariae TaxID=2777116 RepID=A0A8S1H278_9PELO|nr:unnamed protein product [Caenorhabditis auriculariae]